MPRPERFARFVATGYAKRASKRKIVRRRRQLCEHICPWRLADSQTSTECFPLIFSQMPAWPSRRTLSASKILQASRRSQVHLRLFRGRRQQERTTPAEKSAIEFFVRENGGHIVTACMGSKRAGPFACRAFSLSGRVREMPELAADIHRLSTQNGHWPYFLDRCQRVPAEWNPPFSHGLFGAVSRPSSPAGLLLLLATADRPVG
jgi:hypothetical protein